ncbi:MAG: DUF1080 domain-containing protein [Gemmataceae bacterium]|nr:DUF1080 domain-containing protein [Gemmataceae bacterium]
MTRWLHVASFVVIGAGAAPAAAQDNTPPAGFTALFNGKDLTNWQGLMMAPEAPKGDKKPRSIPAWLVKMSSAERAAKQKAANDKVLPHWTITNGVIEYDGKGNNLQTVKAYGNFELYVDWKIHPKGDSGIYLRGNPQVQIWDGAVNKEGSAGLYNNQKHARTPLVNADRPAGEWNTFWIKMVGDRVTIKLNGKLVVDDTPLENYWHRGQALPARGPIELQHHGAHLWFKNIYVKELPDSQ